MRYGCVDLTCLEKESVGNIPFEMRLMSLPCRKSS